MKNEKLHISVWLAAGILLAGTTSGCTKRSLSQRPSDGPLKIEFVWPGETAAAKAVPTGAQVLLYGSDGSLFRTVQCSAEGHECRVPADTYTVLVVNSDRSNAVCDQEESHRDCCVVAADDPDNENAVRHVDNVYCIGEERVEVKPGNTTTTVTLYPQDVVKRIRFSIDPDYIDDIESLGLGMTGVVPSVCLKDCSDAQDGTKNIRAEAQPEGTTGLYTARMSVFGWRGRNIVTATIRHTDGSEETTVPQDISSQLQALADDGGTVAVTLGLPDGGEIAVTATVESWGTGNGSGTAV